MNLELVQKISFEGAFQKAGPALILISLDIIILFTGSVRTLGPCLRSSKL